MLEGVDLPPRGFDPLGHQNIKHFHTREELLQALAALDAGAFDDQETGRRRGTARATELQAKANANQTDEQENIRLSPRRAREQAKREQAQRDQDTELAAAAAPKTKKKGAKWQNWERLSRSLAHSSARQRQRCLGASSRTPRSPSYWTPPRCLPS
jgi:hypothetical protein